MRLQHPLIFCLALMLFACGSSQNDNQTQEFTNRDEDIEKGSEIALDFYGSIIKGDSSAMYGFFAADMDSLVPGLVSTIRERENEWGLPDTFKIERAETHFLTSPKGDTTFYTITLTGIYPYNQSEDVLTIRKTGKNKPELTDYSFSRKRVMQCSEEELENVKPVFEELISDLVQRNDSAAKRWFDPDPKFFALSISIRDEFLPAKLCDKAKIEYHNGYLRRYCGSQNEANGFLTFKVTLDNDELRYLTVYIKKYTDDDAYDMYRFNIGESDMYNLDEDINMAKQLGKEIYRILEHNDYKAFYNALHENARPDNNGKPLSDQEMQELVASINSWGTFKNFEQITTFSMDIDEDGNEEKLIQYIVIARLEGEDGDDEYAELSFKPDSSGRIKLMGIEYM